MVASASAPLQGLEDGGDATGEPVVLARPLCGGDARVTRDLGEAASLLGDVYTPLTIRPHDGPGFRLALRSSDADGARVSTLSISSSLVSTAAMPTYVVTVPRRGTATAVIGRDSASIGSTSGLVVSEGARVQVTYASERCELLTLQFAPRMVEEELAAMLDKPVLTPVRFDVHLDLAARGGALMRLVDCLDEEMLSGERETHPTLVVRRFVRLLVAKLLMVQRHSHSDELTRGRMTSAGPRAVRDAVSAIEADPTAFVTVGDIASHVGVSVRALEDGFRGSLGVTPMSHLRDARLRRAYVALCEADPSETSATAVAHDCGFFHYGRFSANFRSRFGQTPAEVLRN